MKAISTRTPDIEQPKGAKKQRLSVLIVSQYFLPETFGINAVASALADRGHDVTVITGIPNYPSGTFFDGYKGSRVIRERSGGISVIRVPIFPRGQNSRFKLALNFLSFLLTATVLGPFLIPRRRYVIVVNQLSPATSAFPAAIIKLLTRSKLLLWVQDLWPDSISAVEATSRRPVLGALRLYMRAIYRSADIVAAQSRGLMESIAAASSKATDIRYLPNTVDRHYRRVSVPYGAIERRLLRPGFNIVVAGNIGFAQNLETVVRAIQILREEKNIQWTFLGDGSRRVWLERQIHELGLKATAQVLGPYPSEQMPMFFSVADALLVSLRDQEVFARTIPTRLQAYLACGRPILGSVRGECARIVTDSGAGLVSPPNDPQGLANIARSMSQLPHSELIAMGQAARRYHELEFDPDHWDRVLECWLHELSFS